MEFTKANLRKLLVVVSVVAILLSLPSLHRAWLHRIAIDAISVRGGKAHPGSTSRFIFTNPALTPAQLQDLIPYFSNVPVDQHGIDKHNCIVLNLAATPLIDESVVLPIAFEMERVLVFYIASDGSRKWSASHAVREEMKLARQQCESAALQ